MSEKTENRGYQPTITIQKGYQPVANTQNHQGQNTPVSPPMHIVPPKGGTGEVSKK
jgi:hypothetical protein